MSYLVNRKTGIWIGAMDMSPARKKPCLVVGYGSKVVKYASFNSAESADEFMDILAGFFGVQTQEEQ